MVQLHLPYTRQVAPGFERMSCRTPRARDSELRQQQSNYGPYVRSAVPGGNGKLGAQQTVFTRRRASVLLSFARALAADPSISRASPSAAAAAAAAAAGRQRQRRFPGVGRENGKHSVCGVFFFFFVVAF